MTRRHDRPPASAEPGRARSARAPEHAVLRLQRLAGNRAVARLLQRSALLSGSVDPAYVEKLDPEETSRESEAVVAALKKPDLGAAAREVLEGNLGLLEEHAEEEDIELPAAEAYWMRTALRKLAADVSALLDNAGKLPKSFKGLDELKWDIDQIEWVQGAIKEADRLTQAGEFAKAGNVLTAAIYTADIAATHMAYLGVAVQVLPKHIYYASRLFDEVKDVHHELQPLALQLRRLEPGEVNAAVKDLIHRLPTLRWRFSTWIDDLDEQIAHDDRVGRWIDIAMLAWMAFDIWMLPVAGAEILGARGGARLAERGFGIGGIGGGGATAVAGGVVGSVESVAAIRRLVAAGVITSAEVAKLFGRAPIPGAMLRTPGGLVSPAAGPDSGQSVPYGDSRNKHTRVASHPLKDLVDAFANPSSAPADLQQMVNSQGSAAYGGQLSKEAVDNYSALVKDALERGHWETPTRISWRANYDVGINIMNGQATRTYVMHYSAHYGGWHIFPR